LFDNVDDYASKNNAVSDVILHLAQAQYEDSLVADGEVTFAACIIKIINAIS